MTTDLIVMTTIFTHWSTNYLNFEHPTFVPSILANNKTVHFLSLRVHLYYSESDVTSDGFIDNPI